MEVRRTLQPGEMGTKQYLNQYGDKLVCVRYRVDKNKQKRFTTIELIIDEKPFINQKKVVLVWIKISYNETDLREKVKAAGAKWLVEEKLWEMTYDLMKKMKLKDRVIKKLIR